MAKTEKAGNRKSPRDLTEILFYIDAEAFCESDARLKLDEYTRFCYLRLKSIKRSANGNKYTFAAHRKH